MNKKAIQDSIKKLREISKQRKFPQTLDVSINLSKIDLKKNPNQKIDLFLQLPKEIGKKPKICAFVGKELETKAKIFDKVILSEEFEALAKDKKALKKLAREYDYFVAQANLMADIGKKFGKVLAPIGKMPNPKAGCIVPPTADLEPLAKRLASTARLQSRDQPSIKTVAGTESMSDEDLTENINLIFNTITHELPQEKANIKSLLIKFTMSKSVEVTEKGPKFKEEAKKE
ncbi:50S ribosomal protein L1 [Candidatus Woesearchaeota archaeon]|jgi:large subunit ribosomal protein L1|nr:50S ribosomal protein L1 [Candidatus Woesearchaeota archaeon]MBT7237414.1 50S ribosomal protein L1 [Candidatus Woesearchaeota archaeon]